MDIQYHVLKNIVMAEFILVGLIVLFAYALKMMYKQQKKIQGQAENEITTALENVVMGKKIWHTETFLKKAYPLEMLLNALREFDKRYQHSAEWEIVKNKMVLEVLSPTARKQSHSKKWVDRLLSAECFQSESEVSEENNLAISRLLKDDVPIVHLYAFSAAIKTKSPFLIKKAISIMSEKERLSQAMYLQIFDEADEHVIALVKDILEKELDPDIRASCYKILLKFIKFGITFFPPEADLYAKNIELSLASIRYISHIEKKPEVQKLLIKLLSSPLWEVRAVSANLLGELNITGSIQTLSECMKDSVWRVRINAAMALKEMGEKGEVMLKKQRLSEDKFARDTAEYVLDKMAAISSEKPPLILHLIK